MTIEVCRWVGGGADRGAFVVKIIRVAARFPVILASLLTIATNRGHTQAPCLGLLSIKGENAWYIDREMIIIDWANACVVPPDKGKGDKDECASYRGISLVNVVGKVYGKVLIRRIREGTGTEIGEEHKHIPYKLCVYG